MNKSGLSKLLDRSGSLVKFRYTNTVVFKAGVRAFSCTAICHRGRAHVGISRPWRGYSPIPVRGAESDIPDTNQRASKERIGFNE